VAAGFLDIFYYGSFREAVGRDSERVEPPSHVLTIKDLVEWLATQGEPYAGMLADRARVRGAVEGMTVGLEGSMFGAHEVALFPRGGVL
jgi:molybdopterin synthase sulfur carrier subunit